MKIFIEQIRQQKILIAITLIFVCWGCKPQEAETDMVVEKSYGLVNVSVCNMRPTPAHNTELISQATMGTPVMILEKQPGWYYIQTPESYEGWVDSQAIWAMELSEFKEWKKSDRIIFLRKYGDIYADTISVNIISDIVAGSIINIKEAGINHYYVLLPDGRKGFINKKDATVLNEWLSEKKITEENLIQSAKMFTGIPYLWGGTSSKAFDCSGFVKTVYYLNGVILDRDASQQYMHGIKISKESYPDSLRVGDLLFFGYEKNGNIRPTHVGMYIGDTEFIHASGMVRVNSLDSTRSNFSRSRRDAFIGVRRIMGAEPEEGLQPVSTHPWYN